MTRLGRPLGHPVLACPAAGCRWKRPAGRPLCVRCFGSVPQRLRIEVYNTWRVLQRDPSPEAFLAYAAACRDAVAVVEGAVS